MPRIRFIPTVIALVVVAVLVGGYFFYYGPEMARYNAVRPMAVSASDIKLGMLVSYDRGPLASEEYRLEDNNGNSTAFYRVTGRSLGTTSETLRSYTIIAPKSRTYTVPFFFDKLVQDGIWDVTNQPPRGDTNAHYTLSIEQSAQQQHGTRVVTFTDPHYWAVTAGRQYEIKLDKNKPVPDLLKLGSTSVADKRYEALVNDFRNFGTPEFQARVAQVRRQAASGH